jgi:hypothetical protein
MPDGEHAAQARPDVRVDDSAQQVGPPVRPASWSALHHERETARVEVEHLGNRLRGEVAGKPESPALGHQARLVREPVVLDEQLFVHALDDGVEPGREDRAHVAGHPAGQRADLDGHLGRHEAPSPEMVNHLRVLQGRRHILRPTRPRRPCAGCEKWRESSIDRLSPRWKTTHAGR